MTLPSGLARLVPGGIKNLPGSFMNLAHILRQLFTSPSSHGSWEKRDYLREAPTVTQGVDGEKYYQWLQSSKVNYEEYFPTLETHKQLFNGIRYDQIPICYIRVSRNNTIMQFRKGIIVCFYMCI